ncbi:MAG: hypothetical protein COX06_02275 [Candidatus Zambryskibacteria bacterium CG22_combo_CG10-13_8_21_14_all_42_17]|uniref:Uncharacterized protein n=1 Tax=Candidatus Zambryskibacteria bacterium CG22_combo_CG10-13_8_21_14_all_42_17 TaxID=1975118 RepID=A0A2H0BDB5_9BACT|nr:MAG: hypothetical protein COX06_02275 [Candidatus Zambryskibacteria bacterium CG22_combo_CG10-13_8_21_14_all_42_17]
MFQAHRISFLIVLSLLFLLPIFFIPGGAINLSVAKSALLSFGIIAAVLLFLFEIWRAGSISFSKHYLLVIAAILPVIYLLSALLSTPSSLSLLGYNFEIGTFGYILLGVIVLIISATIFASDSRVLQALAAFFISISLVAIFVAIKILFGTFSDAGEDILVWGNFFGNMGNPIGNWTDLAVSFGLLISFSTLALGMIPMKLSARVFVYVIFALGVLLMAIINFTTAFILTLVTSVFLFLYFFKFEKHFFSTATTPPVTTTKSLLLSPTFLPIILGIVSLLFLLNPTISETKGTLGDVVSGAFKVENIDVRPSFYATLGVSKAVLSQDGLLGSGPNTFGRDWLIHKPIEVNTTPFWAVAFPFGIGFIPTQIASTGILGSILWIAFFVFFLMLAVRALSRLPESRDERFMVVSTLLVTVLLWISSFLYTPSTTVLLLAFIFTGLFIAASSKAGIISSGNLNLRGSMQTHVISSVLVIMIAFGALFLGWAGFNRTVSAFHFKKAVELSNTADAPLDEIESEINKAIRYFPADTYYVALSRINFAKAQVAASSDPADEGQDGTLTDNQANFENALRKSIEAARLAVSANPSSYQNWVALGIIYSALVPKPFSVDGAYENAFFAYSEASKRNPANPEIPLLLARLEVNKGDLESARSFIRHSIALKEDYADAYLILARLEIELGNTAGAISSAERLALLTPNNSGIYFELGLLKYFSKDVAGAAEAFNTALRLTPDYANAKYYLGLSLAQLGRVNEAMALLKELLITNPDNPELMAALEALDEN